ncbi:hypothetical protein H1C71_042473 [Ictidomys tridecemlineatus]|nr:hypothetical protein H1C71_042473 [Ictidomys tridecemlineatus]
MVLCKILSACRGGGSRLATCPLGPEGRTEIWTLVPCACSMRDRSPCTWSGAPRSARCFAPAGWSSLQNADPCPLRPPPGTRNPYLGTKVVLLPPMVLYIFI